MDETMVNLKNLLIGIDAKIDIINGKKISSINFDNAATTPPLKSVVEYIISLSNYYGSIGRGAGHKAEITTKIYNESREYLMDFFNIKDKEKYTVIYVSNTTDGMNKLSRTFKHKRDDIILCTRMEHHSNDLPWRRRWKVEYAGVDELGRLKIDEIQNKLIHYKGKIKYVTVTGASNVTGYINDIHKIAKLAHKYGARIIVDGAQLVPHVRVDMSGEEQDENIDFLVFSAHKLYAPFGGGAIIGLKDVFNNNLPDDDGGGTVKIVMDKKIEYLDAPEKNEAGTPNFFGAITISKALESLNNIGFDVIHNNENELKERLIRGLKSIPRVINYADMNNIDDRLGICVFNIESLYHADVAEVLAKFYGISVRQGWFCAHPYCRRLMHVSEKDASAFIYDDNKRMPGMIRVSFGIYNTVEEVDYFLNSIEKIVEDSK